MPHSRTQRVSHVFTCNACLCVATCSLFEEKSGGLRLLILPCAPVLVGRIEVFAVLGAETHWFFTSHFFYDFSVYAEQIVDIPLPQIMEEIMEVVQIKPQEFVQNRTVEQMFVETGAGAACFIEVRRDVHV